MNRDQNTRKGGSYVPNPNPGITSLVVRGGQREHQAGEHRKEAGCHASQESEFQRDARMVPGLRESQEQRFQDDKDESRRNAADRNEGNQSGEKR